MKIVLRKDNLPTFCHACGVGLTMEVRQDPTNPRLEPKSHYWNEKHYLSFCSGKCSLEGHEKGYNSGND